MGASEIFKRWDLSGDPYIIGAYPKGDFRTWPVDLVFAFWLVKWLCSAEDSCHICCPCKRSKADLLLKGPERFFPPSFTLSLPLPPCLIVEWETDCHKGTSTPCHRVVLYLKLVEEAALLIFLLPSLFFPGRVLGLPVLQSAIPYPVRASWLTPGQNMASSQSISCFGSTPSTLQTKLYFSSNCLDL